jgi:hypothetical protein
MDADELAATLGKKPSGGHWNSGIAVLRNNGLIEADGRRYRAAELLREKPRHLWCRPETLLILEP